jgi:anti-anti-sigma factor
VSFGTTALGENDLGGAAALLVTVMGPLDVKKRRLSMAMANRRKVSGGTLPRVIVDLTALPVLDSSTVGELVRATAIIKLGGSAVALVCRDVRQRRLFAVAELAPLFRFFWTEEEARTWAGVS